MTRLNIKTLVFMLAFVPMLLITIILSIYFLINQLNDIDNAINDQGTSMVKHLATASEFGVFSGNKENLNNILQQSLQEEEDLISIKIFDLSGLLLVEAVNNNLLASTPSDDLRNVRHFRHVINLHTEDFSELNEITPSHELYNKDNVLGWIEISMSTHLIDQRRNQIIRDSSVIILLGLIASILLSLRMGKILTIPIIRLTKAVKKAESGNLDTVIERTSSGEIGMLEKGFMSMLGKMRLTQKDLQEKVNETTLGLKNSLDIVEKQNIELTLARTKALEASNAKSRFLANISHEIRTPMNGILGFTRLLKKSNLTKEQFDYLDTIEKSAHNLLALLEDILDLSRVEAGKIVIRNQEFNLRDSIEDIILLMAPGALEKGLDITYFYYRDVPSIINAPLDRIRQVLINFIGNAIKFSEQGTVIIRIMLDPDKINFIRISVSDQGIGIPDMEREYLFTPFSQIDDTSTRKHSGTGLGLAISKSITKAIGGEVGLESNAEQGSTFWFSFPYEESASIGDQSLLIQHPTNIPVFLYDRNPDTRRSIYARVTEAGYTVNECADPEEIVSSVKGCIEKSYIILSLSREEIKDKTIEKIVNKLTKLSKSRVILLISSISPKDKKTTMKWGASACMTKPYRYKDLLKILSDLSSSDRLTEKSNQTIQENPKEQALNGINILLAEDNAINTKLIKTVLGNTGANIIHAENGEEAINYCQKNDFDLILMDIQMPILNGIHATQYIRKSGSPNSNIPIIGMTANASPEDIHTYFESGFNDILIKPITVDNLLEELKHWLNNKENIEDHKSNFNKVTSNTRKILFEDNSVNIQLGISNKLSNELYNMLMAELPGVERLIKELYTSQDWDSLRKQIHKLLGGISYCNVPELKRAVINFQTSLRNRTDNLNTDYETLINEIEKIT